MSNRIVLEGRSTRRMVKDSKQEMWKVECNATIDKNSFDATTWDELAAGAVWIAIQGRSRTLFTTPHEAKEYLTQVISQDVYEAAIKRVAKVVSSEESLMKTTGCTYEEAVAVVKMLKEKNKK